MNKLVYITVLIFSFFLGLGLYDPFSSNGLVFDLLTIITLVIISFNTKVLSEGRIFKNQLIKLFALVLIFFFAEVIYGYTYTSGLTLNLKFISAIIIFWFFSHVFYKDDKLRMHSILFFAISCSVISLIYSIGGFQAVSEIRNGRLLIFGENPNSVSTRMALAFILLVYMIIDNPLKLGKFRFLFILLLPSLFLFIIASGSRGSFLAMVLGIIILTMFSKINKKIKLILVGLSSIFMIWVFSYIQNTALGDRFGADDVSAGRAEIWRNAITIFFDYPLGVGHGGYLQEMMNNFHSNRDTHNLFIYILICGGIFGFLLYMSFLKDLFLKALNSLKRKNSLSIILFFFLFFIMAKTGGVLTYLILWYFLAVINSHNNSFHTKLK